MSDLFKDHNTDWLRSVRANFTPQRIDTTSKDAGDYMKPDCQHPNAKLIEGSKFRIKCPDCRLVTRA